MVFFFLSTGIFSAYGQLGFCSGNSGDPIFTDDFGTGTANNSLPAGTTTYPYTNAYPNDGFYTVSNGTFGNPFDWHQIADHTPGDTNGKCLIVNASFSAGEFYRTTISGLCESTTYEFSAWLINLVISGSFCSTQPGGAIPINVRFEIWDSTDTNLLASGDTGNIFDTPTQNWQEYGLVFQTLAGQNTVILKMINNGIGGCGNDLAIDDIEFKSCGDSITVSDTSNNNTISLCSSETPFGTTITATPDNAVFSNHFYQWQESNDGTIWNDLPGETNQSLVVAGVTTTTFYRAKVAEFAANLSNDDCITFSDIYEINVDQLPPPPTLECWETATINAATCSWDVTGSQPPPPTNLECWETATFNNAICDWEVTGSQPPLPNLECWETATFNNAICDWEVTGSQPPPPTNLECWETATFNNAICDWEVTGSQPPLPNLECWETAAFNDTICDWEVTGSQPSEPTTECWETATFNNTICDWEVTGSQPPPPTNLECWETATFNDAICDWEVTGSQPPPPTLECWETATFNNTICDWEVTGSQPPPPTDLECWETATFNDTLCDWEVSGTQPSEPTDLECWETATFNDTICGWEVTGSQPPPPENLECWETATFSDTLCDWEVTGSQPEEPIDLECWEIATFNNTSCEWEVTGSQPIEFVEEFLQFCTGETLILQASTEIPNSTYEWNTGQTTETIMVSSPGIYIVESTDGCLSIVKTIEVEEQEIPIIESVVTDGNDLIITLVNPGDFLYSIDGINYQSSPIFFDLEGGKYTVYVRALSCDEVVTTEHIHFFIPKFFTPNGDTYNDTFDLKGIECFESSEVYIFDRYGKLLISAVNRDITWDGTFNNEKLPSTDYWYLIKIEGQEFRGHFTLKR